MRLALLSNVTLDLLAPHVEARHRLWMPSGFGAWAETALNPPTELIAFAPEAIVLLLDASRGGVDAALQARVLSELSRRCATAEILVVDLEDLAAETPGFYDDRMWQLARSPWSRAGLEAIAGEIERLLILTTRGGAKKALALDLDNTLWRGVVSEDGVEGIEPFVEFQHGLKALAARGVVLTVLSRNNPEDVEPIWSDARFLLKRTDFAALRINWEEKTANLSALAAALNLGTDAFVFVDDNPVERAAMAARHPEVAVPEFPPDPRDLPRFLRHVERLYFPCRRLTDADRMRTQSYQAEASRQTLRASASFEDYLKALEIRVDVHPLRPDEIARVAQLAVKTNQFNVCTNRYSCEDIAAFADDPTRRIFTASVADRYGDLGLVAFVHVKVAGAEAEILDWVMSCRAMNRRVEFTIEAAIEKALRETGIHTFLATWRKTPKNRPVQTLFDDFQFERIESTDALRRYRKH